MHNGLSLGLASLGRTHLFVDSNNEIEYKTNAGTKVEVDGVALDSETKAALDSFVASFDQSSNAELEVTAEKKADGSVVVEEVSSGLTAEQTSLYADLKAKVKALVEASARTNAKLKVVEKKLGFDTSSVTTETRNGETVYVVTGTETKTAGSYELTKSFNVVIEADTGLILSADMSAHFETITSVSASGSASAVAVGGLTIG